MNPSAQELNKRIESTILADLLSDLGLRLYFPNGIVAQAGIAGKLARNFNATAGVAYEDGEPIILPGIQSIAPDLTSAEFVSYAPTLGDEALRTYWAGELIRKNPSMAGTEISRPAVVPGLTSGIAIAADLFADEGQTVVLPALCWDNYRLIFGDRRGAGFETYPLFDGSGRFDIIGFERTLQSLEKKKTILLFNFPNNPTGFTPSVEEAERIIEAVYNAAESGMLLCIICDDAYFGLFHEDNLYTQSLFSRCAGLHENILAIKVDGPTKEDFIWGFRLGFITFGSKGLRKAHYDALEEKLKGAIRSSFSSSSRTAQSMLLKASSDPDYGPGKERKYRLLSGRYAEVKRVVGELDSRYLTPLPFNSGYFVTFRVHHGNAERLRLALLHEENTGTISIDESHLRVAWAAVDTEKIRPLFICIYRTAERLFS